MKIDLTQKHVHKLDWNKQDLKVTNMYRNNFDSV